MKEIYYYYVINEDDDIQSENSPPNYMWPLIDHEYDKSNLKLLAQECAEDFFTKCKEDNMHKEIIWPMKITIYYRGNSLIKKSLGTFKVSMEYKPNFKVI